MSQHQPPGGDEPSLSRSSLKHYDIRLGGKHKLLHLVECLNSEDPAVRRRAALQLARVGDGRAVDTLVEALDNYEFRLSSQRIRALNLLGTLRDPRSVPLLTRLASYMHPHPGVRIAAVRALRKIGSSSAVAGLREIILAKDYYWTNPKREAVQALIELGDNELFDYLLPFAQARNDNAIMALGCMREERATSYLLDALGETAPFPSDYPERRWKRHLIEALGESGDERAFEPLMQLIRIGLPLPPPPSSSPWPEKHEEEIIAKVFSALGNLDDPRAIESLLEVARSWLWEEEEYQEYWKAAEELIAALGKLGDPRAVPEVMQGIHIPYCLRYVMIALGDIGGSTVVEPLLGVPIKKMNHYERELRVQILDRLYTVDARIPEAIRDALEDRHQSVRKQAAMVLGEHREKHAVEALIRHISEDTLSVRKSARAALRKIGTKQALAALKS